MSFSKSKIKRFNEGEGCAPPVGIYDPKSKDGGPKIGFIKDDRFKVPKDCPLPGTFNMSTFNSSTMSSAGKLPGQIKKNLFGKPGAVSTPMGKDQKTTKSNELENEIKSLLHERTSLEKLLQSKEEELVKLNGRLEGAMKEKSELLSAVATLEKEVKELKKSNDILKSRVLALENAKKRLKSDEATGLTDLEIDYANLQSALIDKEQELDALQNEMGSKLKTMDADFDAAKANIAALQERNNSLEKSLQEVVHHREEVEEKISQLHGLTNQLQSENMSLKQNLFEEQEKNEVSCSRLMKEIEGQQDHMSELHSQMAVHEATLKKAEENLTSSESCTTSLRAYKNSLSDRVEDLEETVKTYQQNKLDYEEEIRNLKGEVFVEKDYQQQEIELKENFNKEIKKLTQQIQDLHENEKSLKVLMAEKQEAMQNEFDAASTEQKSHYENLQSQMQDTLKEHKLKNLDAEDQIRSLKGEVFAERDDSLQNLQHFLVTEARVVSSQYKVKCLEETEHLLNGNLVSMSEKYHVLEQTLELAQKEKTTIENQLRSELNAMKTALEQEKNESQQFKESNRDLIDHVNQEKEEKTRLSEKLEEVKQETSTVIDNMKGQADVARSDISRLEETVASLNTDKTNVVNYNNGLEIDVANLKKQLTEAIDLRTSTEENLTKEVKSAKEELQILKTSNNKRQLTIGELEEGQQYLEERIESTLKELTIQKKKKTDLEKMSTELERQLIEVIEQKKLTEDNLTAQLDDARDKIQTLTNTSSERQDTIDELEQTRKCLEGRLRLTTDSLKQLTDQYEETKTEMDAEVYELKKQLTETIEERNCTEETLTQQVNVTKKEIQVLANTNSERQITIDELSVSRRCLEEKLGATIEEMERLTVQNDAAKEDLKKRIIELEGQLTESCEERKYIESNLTAQLGSANEVLQAMAITRNEQNITIDELGQANTSLEARLALTTKEMEHLVEQSNTANIKHKDEVIEFEKQLTEALQERNAIEDKLTAQVTGTREEVQILSTTNKEQQASIDHLKQDQKILEERLSSEIEKFEELIHQTKVVKEQHNVEVDSYKCQMHSLQEDIAQKESHVERLQSEFVTVENEKTTQINNLEMKVEKKQEEIDRLLDLNDQLSSKLSQQAYAVKELSEMKAKWSSFEAECQLSVNHAKAGLLHSQAEVAASNDRCVEVQKELKQQIELLEERNNKMKDEYSRRIVETQTKLSKSEAEFMRTKTDQENAMLELEENHSQEVIELHDKIKQLTEELENVQGLKKIADEANSWQIKFQELQAKVLPFQDQLDAYEAEKQALLGQKKDYSSEFNKLEKQYATLLGHQNQKQKIKHVMKIKEEKTHLKQENGKLQEQILKQKRTINRLEDHISGIEGHPKRFDPSKAFQHCKENMVPRSPLKDGNR